MESIENMRNCVQTIAADCDEGWILGCLDEIEKELAERYVELPCDKYGRPLRVGDVVAFCGDRYEVCAIRNRHVVLSCISYKLPVHGNECVMIHHMTLEDMLRDFASRQHGITTEEGDALVEEYAERIRELVSADSALGC